MPYHYTDRDGYNAIVSQPTWRFVVSQPPGDHPVGAYFTDLPRTTKNLAIRLRIPRWKLAWFFLFTDVGDLSSIPGDRGEHIYYSPTDYSVSPARQIDHGETGL